MQKRPVVLFLCFTLLFILPIWYGSLGPAPEMHAYPTGDDLARDYDHYIGDRVVVSGDVKTTDPLTIASEYDPSQTIELTIIGTSSSIQSGTELQVYGIVRGDRTIEAINTLAIPQRGFWYSYTVSFIAGLWVLGRIFRGWRFNRDALALEPRHTPLSVLKLLRKRTPLTDPESESDA